MMKSGNSINIDKILENPTEEENGVEVKINVKETRKFVEALNYLIFFPNVYIENKSFYSTEFNDCKIKKYKNFAVKCNKYGPSYDVNILLGNVLYPLDKRKLNPEACKIVDNLYNKGISLLFNIGDLEITPNRESLIYTEEVVNKLNTKIHKVEDELLDILEPIIIKDYDNLLDYINSYIGCLEYSLINEKVSDVYNVLFSNNILLNLYESKRNKYPTYKGNKIYSNEYRNAYAFIKEYKLPNLIGFVGITKVYTTKIPLNYSYKATFKNYEGIIEFPKNIRISGYLKSYLYSKLNNYCITYAISKEDFIKELFMSNSVNNITTEQREIAGAFYDEYQKDKIEFNPETDKEFLEYKEEMKNDKKKFPTSSTIEVELHYSDSSFPDYFKYSSIKELEDYFNKTFTNKATVIANKRYEYMELLKETCLYKHYNLLLVNKPYVKKITNIKGLIQVEDIVNENNPFVVNVFTNDKLLNKCPIYINEYKNLFNSEIKSIYDDYYHYKYFTNVSSDVHSEIYNLFPNDTFKNFNKHFVYCSEKLVEISEKVEKVKNDLTDAGIPSYVITGEKTAFAFFIMKSKAFRINYKYYKQIKLNNLLKNI